MAAHIVVFLDDFGPNATINGNPAEVVALGDYNGIPFASIVEGRDGSVYRLKSPEPQHQWEQLKGDQ